MMFANLWAPAHNVCTTKPSVTVHRAQPNVFILAALLFFTSMGCWAVMPGATTTTVTSSANPSLVGQSVTFTATVVPQSPQMGTATGTVTLLADGSSIGSNTLSGSPAMATFSTSVLAPGSHTITVHYDGDNDWNAGNGALTGNPQIVKINTLSAVMSSANPSVFGQLVTFTATVSPVSPGTGTPSGSVNFLDGSSFVGTGGLSGGIAVFSTSILSVGSHTITTSYAGSGNFNGSTGSLNGNPQVVNKVDTTTTVSTTCMTTFVAMQPFTVNATLSGIAPTGSVTFYDGGGDLCSNVAMSAGMATCTSSTLAVGGSATKAQYSINVSYGGDTNNNASVSASPLVVTVLSASDVIFRNGLEPESMSCPIE